MFQHIIFHMKVIIIWYKHKEIKVFENKLSNFDLWVQYSLFSFTTQKKAFPEIPIWSSKYGLFWEVVDVVRRCTKWKYDKKWTHMNPKDTLDAIRKFRWISSIDHEFWLSTIITYSTFKKFQFITYSTPLITYSTFSFITYSIRNAITYSITYSRWSTWQKTRLRVTTHLPS